MVFQDINKWNRLTSRLLISGSLTLIAAVFSLSTARAEPVRFIALGDMPYGEAQDEQFRKITKAISETKVPFVVHYGDFKKGSAPCSTELMRDALNEIFSLHDKVIYTPGDNDWTDCDRKSTGSPLSELFMLDRLRDTLQKQFASQKNVLPKLEHQPLFPENAIWSSGGVVFITLHIVGSNNGRDEVLLDNKKLARTLVQARDYANSKWLKVGLRRAIDEQADAIIVTSQADLTDETGRGDCKFDKGKCDGFKYITKKLRKVAADWDNPMLYIHGDTDDYCLDKTFGGDAAPKLWRLNGPGDYWVNGDKPGGGVLDAAEIVFQPSSKTAFTVKTLLDGQAPAAGCPS